MNKSEKRILIAEDQDMLKDMLATVLSDENYLVSTAENGDIARQLLDSQAFDLVLTDLYMPIMNGIDLILYTQKYLPKTKLILLSGGGKELIANNGSQTVLFNDQTIDVDLFLKKPCDLLKLLETVENLLTN